VDAALFFFYNNNNRVIMNMPLHHPPTLEHPAAAGLHMHLTDAAQCPMQAAYSALLKPSVIFRLRILPCLPLELQLKWKGEGEKNKSSFPSNQRKIRHTGVRKEGRKEERKEDGEHHVPTRKQTTNHQT
jgi:hypothetical protein